VAPERHIRHILVAGDQEGTATFQAKQSAESVCCSIGEEQANILLLASCYQERPSRDQDIAFQCDVFTVLFGQHY
jgi:hypothetical protein